MNMTSPHSPKKPLLLSFEQQQVAQAELQLSLLEWNTTQAVYPKEQCIPQLFEAQVERTPERTALIFDRQELSYRVHEAPRLLPCGHMLSDRFTARFCSICGTPVRDWQEPV